MERPTTEVVLPFSKIKVYLVNRLQYGESLQIDKALADLTDVSFDPDTAERKADLKPGWSIHWARKKLEIVVKKMTDAEGKDLPLDFDQLDNEDGRFLEQKVEEVLSEIKKK